MTSFSHNLRGRYYGFKTSKEVEKLCKEKYKLVASTSSVSHGAASSEEGKLLEELDNLESYRTQDRVFREVVNYPRKRITLKEKAKDELAFILFAIKHYWRRFNIRKRERKLRKGEGTAKSYTAQQIVSEAEEITDSYREFLFEYLSCMEELSIQLKRESLSDEEKKSLYMKAEQKINALKEKYNIYKLTSTRRSDVYIYYAHDEAGKEARKRNIVKFIERYKKEGFSVYAHLPEWVFSSKEEGIVYLDKSDEMLRSEIWGEIIRDSYVVPCHKQDDLYNK